jgi:transposase InsO family protein
MRAKITDGKHTGTMHTSTIPWMKFAMDITGPFMQASIKSNRYQCIVIDTYSKYVWTYFIVTKDEVYSVISDFCETENDKLRGRDTGSFELFLISDLGEAHSKKIFKLCSQHGMVKQNTAGYTPQVNAFVERYFRTNGEMSRCQLASDVYA